MQCATSALSGVDPDKGGGGEGRRRRGRREEEMEEEEVEEEELTLSKGRGLCRGRREGGGWRRC